MNAIIAVPSMSPGGLDAAASPHFGHCDVFTLVEVRDGIVGKTTTLPTPNHQQGGCMVPVNLLASSGATAIAAGGMGRRPLMGFLEVGIQPYLAIGYDTVGAVIEAFLAGKLEPFAPEFVCGGGGHDHAG
jgi:predicted Fe-Mo cluster-binding NifX family protein